MNRNAFSAFSDIRITVRMLHRFPITQKNKQVGHIHQARASKV
ncbi:hypothetical protein AIOL_002167 [Candidatus Rhodobacter oscarellae]|uniref:Uncharacterized protein n=1 Tax=Candidatus Rhodobacter oscarellae TaxID=1675527 RepID=A0A0J9E2X6_9RHOB|nr:hypothetical protein AIOL_002167 [Candidatus Rhodobacter lobularis]